MRLQLFLCRDSPCCSSFPKYKRKIPRQKRMGRFVANQPAICRMPSVILTKRQTKPPENPSSHPKGRNGGERGHPGGFRQIHFDSILHLNLSRSQNQFRHHKLKTLISGVIPTKSHPRNTHHKRPTRSKQKLNGEKTAAFHAGNKSSGRWKRVVTGVSFPSPVSTKGGFAAD